MNIIYIMSTSFKAIILSCSQIKNFLLVKHANKKKVSKKALGRCMMMFLLRRSKGRKSNTTLN